ncbi:hypothetical protein EV127DRAFT_512854 [Xylaria flabelliformis]|nr:hypothetical protein EV127DRAFT_512854 [Xylaria flabelliformis]
MRASTSFALGSFVAAAAAVRPFNGPPDQNITLTVAAGSSLAGHQLIGFIDGEAAGFPAFVTAAEAAESSSTVYMFYKDYGHFGWYSLNIDVAGTKYGLDIDAPDNVYQGLVKFIDSESYGTNIWKATTDSSAFTWTGDSRDFPFACTGDDGHARLGIFTPGSELENCEQVQLEWKTAA